MLSKIIKIAQEAGLLALKASATLQESSIVKKSEKDMVTNIDIKVQNFIQEKFKLQFPHIEFCGEEGDEESKLSDREVVIVDPIDGTNNFIHGHPYFNTSIAYRKNRKTLCAVVYAPALGDIYYAEQGNGAYRNDKRIKVSQKKKLIECIGITGFSALRAGVLPNNLDLFPQIVQKIQSVRVHGASALDICLIAEGRFDLLWFLNLNSWDTAAAELILNEAGGTVSDFQGKEEHEEKKQIVASNGYVHDELLSIIQNFYN